MLMYRDNRNSTSSMIATTNGGAGRGGMLLCHLLLLAVLALSSSTSTSTFAEAAEAAEAVASDTEQIFGIQYSTTTTCSGSAVSFMGLLPNTTYPGIKAFMADEDDGNNNTTSISSTTKNSIDMSMLSCAEQAICLIDSKSELCLDMNPPSELTDGIMYVRKNGEGNDEAYWIQPNGEEFTYIPLSNSCIDSSK
jgi:hypothetical protein